MNYLITILLAISLSMDAFSLSLAYGMVGMDRSKQYLLAFIVGIYHFVMPILGLKFGHIIIKLLPVSVDWIAFIIFAFIGLSMIKDSFSSTKEGSSMNLLEMLLFGLAVSIDSFMTGIGLINTINNEFVTALTFAVCSSLFTFFGLKLGCRVNQIMGNISAFLGGTVLVLIGFTYLFMG